MSLKNNNSKKCIFIYATDGFNDRFILKSGLVERLKKKTDLIVIFYKHGDKIAYKREFEDNKTVILKAEDKKYKEYVEKNKLYRVLIQFRAYINNGNYDTFIVDWFRKIFIAEQKWNMENGLLPYFIGRIWEIVSNIFKKSYFLRKSLIYFESKFLVTRPHKKYFEKYNPDLVIVSSLSGIVYNENFAREAKNFGVKVCSIMGSWDYAIGLGVPGFEPDYVSAWNEDMKNDLVNLNDINKKIISINGIPYWDSRYNKKQVLPRDEFFTFFGLDPQKKIILNATHPPKRFPWGPEFVSNLVESIKANRINNNCQIIIRLHPTHYHDEKDNSLNNRVLDKYQKLMEKNDIVVLNVPNTRGTRKDFSFGNEENIMMNSLLKYSDVMVTMFSTMQIEAAIFNLPVVNYALREIADADYQSSRLDPQSVLKMPHVKRILDTNGVRTALNFDELYLQINNYLDNPKLDSEGRKTIEKQFVGDLKGVGSKKTAEYIFSLIGK